MLRNWRAFAACLWLCAAPCLGGMHFSDKPRFCVQVTVRADYCGDYDIRNFTPRIGSSNDSPALQAAVRPEWGVTGWFKLPPCELRVRRMPTTTSKLLCVLRRCYIFAFGFETLVRMPAGCAACVAPSAVRRASAQHPPRYGSHSFRLAVGAGHNVSFACWVLRAGLDGDASSRSSNPAVPVNA